MPDVTYSVKVSEEDQERIKTLVSESGLNNKDFFVNMIAMYELQKAKQDTPILTADIEELETLTRRMNSIFVNVSERINTLQRETKDEQERQAETNQSTISLLQQRINGLEQDRLHDEERIQLFIEEKERAEQRAAELQNRIKEIEDATKDKAALVEEYKRKNDDLSGVISEYKTAAEKSKELERQNTELAAKIEEQRKDNLLLSERMDEISIKHAEDLKRQQETLNIEREKALLNLKMEHQRELQEQAETHSIKINDYEDKVKSLLERLETNQAITPKTSATSSRSKKPASKKATGTDTTEEK